MLNHKVDPMKNSTNFIEKFDQEAYHEMDNDFDAGYDDLLFEQLEEVVSDELDFNELDDFEEDDDNFDGIF